MIKTVKRVLAFSPIVFCRDWYWLDDITRAF